MIERQRDPLIVSRYIGTKFAMGVAQVRFDPGSLPE